MRTVGLIMLLVPMAIAADFPEDRVLATAKSLFTQLQTETLSNGLQIFMLPIEGAQTVTTMVAYKVGSGDEAKDQTGLSHYLEHLLFKGTDKLMPGDIDRLTQRNGGQNNASTDHDMTLYYFDFARDRWLAALEIEADRMRNTRIDDRHEFQQEKGAVIAELKKYEDTPWDLEEKAILPRLFSKAAPYSHPIIGQEAHVRDVTAEAIRRYYDAWYHPNNAAIVIVGGFDPKEAVAKVKELFGAIPKGELPTRVAVPNDPPRTQQVRHEFPSKFDVPRVYLGFNTVAVGDPDDYVLDVLSALLSRGKTSRLYSALVEGEQIAADVNANNNTGRYPGWFGVQVELLPGKNRAQAEALVFKELKKLADAPVTEEELNKVRRSILASYIFGGESAHGLAQLIAKSVTLKDIEYLKTYLERVMAVTPEQVQAAAIRYFKPESAVVVWSVPAGDGPGGDAKPAKPMRTEREAGGTGGYDLSKTQRVVLPNGLKLLMLENHRLPIVAATVFIGDVRMHEPANQSGVAALVGQMLEEGTDKHTGVEIAKAIERVGGVLSLSASGGNVRVLSADTALGLGLLFECISRPSFPQERLDAMREILLSEIQTSEIEPERRAALKFQSAVYGDHPLGRSSLGDAKIVEKLTAADCRAFHQRIFVPNNATVVVVGDFQAGEMAKMIENLTADWKIAAVPQPAARPPADAKATEIIVSDPSASQTHVYLGHLGITRRDADYYKLLVMDNVLGVGAGFTDRLSSTLRDRQGLAYTVNASITSTAGEQPGMFRGYIGTFPDKYIWVRDGFLREIRRLRDEPPTDQEVADAKSYLLGRLPFRLETSSDIAGELLAIERFGLGMDAHDKYRAAIAAVTPADVQAMAKKHLDPTKMTIVAVGPIDKTGRPLAAKKGNTP